MKKITAMLGALDKMLHEVHLSFNIYGEHLLADRLRGGISENVDRLKELSISDDGDLSIAAAVGSVEGIYAIVKEFSPKTMEGSEKDKQEGRWLAIRELYISLIAECSVVISRTDSEGIANALGDISESLMRNKYLVDGVLKGYGHPFKK